MLAMLVLNTIHNALYESNLRHPRNCIDERNRTSMIELPNRSMLLSVWVSDTIYCGHAASDHAVVGFWANEAQNLVPPEEVSRSPKWVCTNVHIGRMPVYHAQEVPQWPQLILNRLLLPRVLKLQ